MYFDEAKMRKMLGKNEFLNSVHSDGISLKEIFSTYVVDDANLAEEYEKI